MTTAQLSVQGCEIVYALAKRKGWHKMSMIWVDVADVSSTTLKRFWQRKAIRIDNFKNIAEAVGVDDWQNLITSEPAEVNAATNEDTEALKTAVIITGLVSATNHSLVEMLLDAISIHLQSAPFCQWREANDSQQLLCFQGSLALDKLGEVEALLDHIQRIEPELLHTLQ